MFASHALTASHAVSPAWPFLGLGAYLVTSIFYVFPSGTPQPADFLLVLVIVSTLLVAWARLPDDPMLYLVAGLMVAWILLVNAIWFLLTGDFVFLKKTSFYVYNLLVFLFVIAAGFHDWERLRKVVWWACVLALLAQVGWMELFPDATRRATGTFNNPNQLGYWALLLMACMAVVKGREGLGALDVLALGAGLYVTALSLSKAASISAIVLLACIGVASGLRRSAGLLLCAALVLGLAFQMATGSLVDRIAALEPVEALAQRLESIGRQRDDSFLARGYPRLIENLEHLAFGAGEGSFDRLSEDGSSKEFHSTLGNLLMSYGVPGVALFTALIVVVGAAAPRNLLYLMPIMLYGLTHMGLRFSLFWVFLGLAYAQGRYARPAAGDLGGEMQPGPASWAAPEPEPAAGSAPGAPGTIRSDTSGDPP
ncbi:MAG TPA: hypothetical protein VFZ01_20395 [Geminicoccaceae bacterium]